MLELVDGLLDKQDHVDCCAHDESHTARVPNLILCLGIGSDIREHHQVIHDDDELDLVESFHFLVIAAPLSLNVAIGDDHSYARHVEDKDLQPQLLLVDDDSEAEHELTHVVDEPKDDHLLVIEVEPCVNLSILALFLGFL